MNIILEEKLGTKRMLGQAGLIQAARPFEYTVPAGIFTLKSLIVYHFNRGDDSSLRVTLYWDDGVALQTIDQTPIFTRDGKNYRLDFSNVQFTSDGSAKLIIDRTLFNKNGPRFTSVVLMFDLS